MRAIDLTGHTFGRLTVMRFAGHQGNKRTWQTYCACGNHIVVLGESLRSGNTKSCGCKKVDRAEGIKLRHGEARHNDRTPEYRTWKGMVNRCECPTSSAFAKYGGRGVQVCRRWRDSYEAFLADMGRKPSAQHSIDRINPFGNYEPSNCRWATATQQRHNRRDNYDHRTRHSA
jgi:hypothetical protein